MGVLFMTVLSVSLSGAILALLLFVLKPVLRNRVSKAFSYYIWMLVLLRLLLPFGYGISLPVAIPAPEPPQVNADPFEEDRQGEQDDLQSGGDEQQGGNISLPGGNGGAQGSYEDVQGGSNQQQGNLGGYEDIQGGNNGQQSVPDTGVQIPELPQTGTDVTVPESATFHLWSWIKAHIGYIWIAGAVLGFGWYVASYGVFSWKIRRTLSQPDEEDQAQFEALRGKARVKLMCSDRIRVPMLMGVFHPVIVVPRDSYVAAGKRDVFCCIVLHELTHYHRKDVAVKWLGIMTASIHWFNPVVYFVRREIDNACELSCDEALISNMSVPERKFYGNALLAFAGEQQRPSRVVATTIYQGKKQLKGRLTSIMNYKKCSGAAVAMMLVLALVLTGCAAAYVNLGTENEDPDTPIPQWDTVTDVVPEEYLQVLHNEKGFLLDGQTVLIAEYNSPYLQKRLVECDTAKYAAVDMDGDGKKELLLRGWSDDILVLHEEDGTVYGYDFTFRVMYNVKLDGTYFWNENAGATHGCSTLSFDDGSCRQSELYRAEQEGDAVKYFVANAEASKAEYDAVIAQRPSVQELAWHSLRGYIGSIKPDDDDSQVQNPDDDDSQLAKPEEYPADPAVLQAYLSVLKGSREFDCLGVGNLKIDQLNRVENALGDGTVTVTKLAVLDMDSDTVPEVALELKADNNEYYGFLLLDCRWDTVYGYFLNYRGFMDLKTDGTFHWSSGAAKNGYSKLRFADNGYVPNHFIYTTSHQDTQGNTLVYYYVDHKSVTEAEFRRACTQQDAKETAVWYAFTEENLKVLFGTDDKPAEQPGHSTPITSYIEALFPPKGSTIIMEGYIVEMPIVAGGREPVIAEDGTCTTPGFAIYYDPALFYMTEENGNTYIRGIPVSHPGKEDLYASLPPTEIEIRYIPNVAPAVDAEAVRNEMLGSYQTVSEPAAMQNGKGAYFHFSNGTNWDSACGDIKFISDGRSGTFRITSRYIFEAVEGVGIRFSNMVSTFAVIDPQALNKA